MAGGGRFRCVLDPAQPVSPQYRGMVQATPSLSTMDAPSHAEPADLFAGDSELAAMMRAKDWAQSPLGPPGQWPTRRCC